MISISKKNKNRLGQMALNTMYSLIMRFQTFIWSALVIASKDIAFWGQFVPILITFNLCSHFIKFGNAGFLLKEFSLTPSSISNKWWTSLIARLPIFIVTTLLILLFSVWEWEVRILIVLWLFLAFIYQSFDVIVQYHRLYMKGLVIEMLGILVILVFVYYLELSQLNLVLTGVVMMLLKLILYIVALRKEIGSNISLTIDFQPLKQMLPFFMIGIVGLLSSRLDVYVVSYFESDAQVGRYQIFINLVMIFMSGVQFIASPYTKNLYRLNRKGLNNVIKKLFLFGVMLGTIWLCVDAVILWYVYQQLYTVDFYVLAFLLIVPIYMYFPLSVRLFKNDLSRQVTYVNAASVLLNFTLNFLFVPHYSLIGALIGTAVSQWFLFFSYLYLDKTLIKG